MWANGHTKVDDDDEYSFHNSLQSTKEFFRNVNILKRTILAILYVHKVANTCIIIFRAYHKAEAEKEVSLFGLPEMEVEITTTATATGTPTPFGPFPCHPQLKTASFHGTLKHVVQLWPQLTVLVRRENEKL